MFQWIFKRRHRIETAEDWITVPFRFAEAARVSIHTIASQKEIPAEMKLWIASWLDSYNRQLVAYMEGKYGSGIYPILDAITTDVMQAQEPKAQQEPPVDQLESFAQWEKQLYEDREDGK